jgi:hypothetical protein
MCISECCSCKSLRVVQLLAQLQLMLYLKLNVSYLVAAARAQLAVLLVPAHCPHVTEHSEGGSTAALLLCCQLFLALCWAPTAAGTFSTAADVLLQLSQQCGTASLRNVREAF